MTLLSAVDSVTLFVREAVRLPSMEEEDSFMVDVDVERVGSVVVFNSIAGVLVVCFCTQNA
jgi:hypothetical protein